MEHRVSVGDRIEQCTQRLVANRARFSKLANGDSLLAAIERKIVAVDARTRATVTNDHEYGYATDPLFIRNAAKFALEALEEPACSHLRFERELTEHLGLDPKPQLILDMRTESGGARILKAYGRERVNEGWLLDDLGRAGHRVPKVHAHSMTPDGGWLLMDASSGSSLGAQWAASRPALADLIHETKNLAGAVSKLHDYQPQKSVGRTVFDGVGIHMQIAIERLTAFGLDVDARLWDQFENACTPAGSVLLHGDVSPGNVLLDNEGDQTLIDISGYTGPRSYDAAAWAVRVGATYRCVSELADAWSEVETTIDPQELNLWIRLEAWRYAGLLLMEGHQRASTTGMSIAEIVELARSNSS